jgi:hypothetical protein
VTHPLCRSLLLGSLAAWFALAPAAGSAQADPSVGEVLVFKLDDATLETLLATPGFAGLAQAGGAALLSVAESGAITAALHEAAARQIGSSVNPILEVDLGSMAAADGRTSSVSLCNRAADEVLAALDASGAEDTLVIVASSSPPAANEEAGDHLGAIVMAEGAPEDLATAMRTVPVSGLQTLTSDSTRRVGVVTSGDLAETAVDHAGLEGLEHPTDGEQIRVLDAPPPIELHARYLQSKRLTVPIGTAAALFVTLGGLLAVWALAWARSPRWLRSACAWIAISSPFLALSLLLVGHLGSLTYATVIPFVIAATVLPTLALVPVARRRGTLVAVAVAGAILLAALAVEAGMGWTAALTPLLGGSQLDGGRFFGLPNAFIGLLLGGSIYVAQRLPRTAGTVLIAATGLFAGLPWTGSNMGAAVTLFAAAGIWWGLRGRFGWLLTTSAALASVLAGSALVVVAHRSLTSAPTHITRFSERTGGVVGLWDKLVDRLQVGTDLIAANPFALVPVIGVLVTLVVVLRPPSSVRVTFEESPVWREALLAIVLGSVVAYLVNDSGAAAIGEGFTTSLGALLFVSLLRRNDIMGAA